MMHAVIAGFVLTEPAQALPGFKKVAHLHFFPQRTGYLELSRSLLCLIISAFKMQDLKSRRKLKIPESEYKEGPQGLK